MAPQIERQTIPEAAVEADVMREQLDYLIQHAASSAPCACSACERFARARSVLLEIFNEPQGAKVLPMPPQFAKAA